MCSSWVSALVFQKRPNPFIIIVKALPGAKAVMVGNSSTRHLLINKSCLSTREAEHAEDETQRLTETHVIIIYINMVQMV